MKLTDGRKIEVDKNDFSLQLDNEKINFDAVFIGMHGTPGEDGKLQGYFDTLKIPYTSCDAATSAITFNKRYTVAVAKWLILLLPILFTCSRTFYNARCKALPTS